jgi:histidyl-tRNA synthetase
MGEDRVVLALQERGRAAVEVQPQVSVITAAEGSAPTALRLASTLRVAGLRVTVQSGSRSLKAHMRQAQKVGAPVVLILGDDELASGQVVVRDMVRGEQEIVPQDAAEAAVETVLARGATDG